MTLFGPREGIASEDIAGSPDFRHLSTIAGIAVDLRYATPNNFVGRDLYAPYDCAWLHRDAASALERAVAWLARERPGYTALVLDALRPQRVVAEALAFHRPQADEDGVGTGAGGVGRVALDEGHAQALGVEGAGAAGTAETAAHHDDARRRLRRDGRRQRDGWQHEHRPPRDRAARCTVGPRAHRTISRALTARFPRALIARRSTPRSPATRIRCWWGSRRSSPCRPWRP